MKLICHFLIISTFSSAFGQVTPNPERFKYDLFGNNLTINLFELWDNKNSFPKDPILFVGSSSIRFWYTSNYFPEFPIINRGFGGSHISDISYFINETVLKYKPEIIVFYAGDNDISYGNEIDFIIKRNISDNLSFESGLALYQPEPIIDRDLLYFSYLALTANFK